jgi:photosystem II stability/assembly factor-like uncharacterized protein
VQLFGARRAIGGLAVGAAATITLTSRSGNGQWRFGVGGRIERSADRGQTWQPQVSGVTSDLLGGAAPSDKVAWIVGHAGVILRTTDGEHWLRVPSPDTTADWSSVEATDALRATITSATQSRFTTEDGGETWRQQ